MTTPSLRSTVDANLESAMALLDVIEAELVGVPEAPAEANQDGG
jgi:hypothetical protein